MQCNVNVVSQKVTIYFPRTNLAVTALPDTDPNVHHELGILYGRKSDGAAATACLERALELMESLDAASDRHREPTLAALGRTWHMRGYYDLLHF